MQSASLRQLSAMLAAHADSTFTINGTTYELRAIRVDMSVSERGCKLIYDYLKNRDSTDPISINDIGKDTGYCYSQANQLVRWLLTNEYISRRRAGRCYCYEITNDYDPFI